MPCKPGGHGAGPGPCQEAVEIKGQGKEEGFFGERFNRKRSE